MFTGIIEEVGTVKEVRRNGNNSFIRIHADKILSDVHLGDSIAVNGVCLTVTAFDGKIFQADVMNETLNRSSLGTLRTGSPVNLERAMSAGGRFGGHIVSGHIDGTGNIINIKNDGIAVWYTIK
ncbi:MAG: riboflavin synthase, partial [Ruminococcus sp.]|nr:riboflavin synthase [Ruminococcus sp.]